MRDDINCIKVFRNNVKMKENNNYSFFIEFNNAWVENHLHVSSSKNCSMLSNATGYPLVFCHKMKGSNNQVKES